MFGRRLAVEWGLADNLQPNNKQSLLDTISYSTSCLSSIIYGVWVYLRISMST